MDFNQENVTLCYERSGPFQGKPSVDSGRLVVVCHTDLPSDNKKIIGIIKGLKAKNVKEIGFKRHKTAFGKFIFNNIMMHEGARICKYEDRIVSSVMNEYPCEQIPPQ